MNCENTDGMRRRGLERKREVKKRKIIREMKRDREIERKKERARGIDPVVSNVTLTLDANHRPVHRSKTTSDFSLRFQSLF